MIHSIAERDIYTGDGCDIWIIDKDGQKREKDKVRRDWNLITII